MYLQVYRLALEHMAIVHIWYILSWEQSKCMERAIIIEIKLQ